MSAHQTGACGTRQPNPSVQARLRRSRRPATHLAAAQAPGQIDERPYAAPRAVVELTGRQRRTVQLDGGTPSITAEPPAGSSGASGTSSSSSGGTSSIDGPLAALRDFFLPKGWPATVSADYLSYQLATVPAHISGWMSHSLATSSMIQALGMGTSPVAAVATSAAIKWITKDGLGAAGRLIVGGRLASVFDEDPRRWRMVAEGVSTLGLALEIATQMYPAQFVALAGTGTLAKSMAKGMGRPCFRVIQAHFSTSSNNFGDVAAKEEVWEVVAQLAGLASSVVLLQALEAGGRPEAVIPAWAAVHAVHVSLRYVALRSLRFPYPNQKRAAALASAHVASGRMLSIDEGNAAEQILLPPSACRPHVEFGCTLDEALPPDSSPAVLGLGGGSAGSAAARQLVQQQQLEALVQLYRGERYLLTWHGGTAWVLLLEGAGQADQLRAVWQAAWLDQHSPQQLAAASSNGSGGPHTTLDNASSSPGLLAASLQALHAQWPGFEEQARGEGWQLERAVLPQGRTRLRLEG